MLVLVFLSLRSALFVSLCLSRGSMCVGGNGGVSLQTILGRHGAISRCYCYVGGYLCCCWLCETCSCTTVRAPFLYISGIRSLKGFPQRHVSSNEVSRQIFFR